MTSLMNCPAMPAMNGLLVVLAIGLLGRPARCADPASSISVPPGFEASLFADDELAHDIFALTVDARGRVVVSGPGYVRILIDEDLDGRADASQTYAEGPSTGAQGLYFDGPDLLCTGDGGLLRYRDRDGDGRADGPPETLLKLQTGGEHFAHAVNKGPDGWWYVILGNLAVMSAPDVPLPSSPVTTPSAGVLLRIAPDFSGFEVVADGFRNPYDFAFHPLGDVFVFDSDGERDVSLPWYRPTRVFQVLPGTHAGWVSTSWKYPDYFPEMPPAAADCGRGSPTGMVFYRHHQFPAKYSEVLFALDWTFGRVLAIPLTRDGSRLRGQVETFLTATGEFGFAPTDIAVTPTGDLMISVGGRGTRGGVYRVHYVDDRPGDVGHAMATIDSLTQCLTAPQPLASWSRARWVPFAQQLGGRPFTEAALDARRSIGERVRAIEIVTELFGGLDAAAARTLLHDPSADVRARAIWSLGCRSLSQEELGVVGCYLEDEDPVVTRGALEALRRQVCSSELDSLLPRLRCLLDAPDRAVRQAAWQTLSRLNARQRVPAVRDLSQASARTRVSYALALTHERQPDRTAFDLAWQVLQATSDASLRLDALRAAQRALGDFGGAPQLAPLYDGYAGPLCGSGPLHEPGWNVDLNSVIAGFPSDDASVDYELARLLALLAPANPMLAEKLAEKLSDASDPVDDIHYLIVLSRLSIPWTAEIRHRVATALVQLEPKLRARSLQQDLNWELHVGELTTRLVGRDPQLASLVIEHPLFGLPGHIVLTQALDQELRSRAAERVADYLERNPDTAWTGDVIFLLGASTNRHHRELVRQQFEDLSLQGSVILALAAFPEGIDRPKFVTGLRSPDLAVVRACVQAMERLPASEEAEYQFALLDALRRLGADRHERLLRDRVARLLQHNLGHDFGYQFGRTTIDPQAQAVARLASYLRQRFPDAADGALMSSAEQLAALQNLLSIVHWGAGEGERGEELFQRHSCAGCHNTRTAVGPDLAGIAKRFARDDLFTAIALPNRDVSPRYNTTLIETTRGTIVSGLIVYESADGVTLRDSTNQTIRIASDEIAMRQQLSTSLMPAGLLDGLEPRELADLYAYLRSL